MTLRTVQIIGNVVKGTVFCLVATAAAAGEVATGAEEFRISCASCHGLDGKGSGPLAAILSAKPADLTNLSMRYDERFPAAIVYRMIDGREEFYAHGDREMPVWGIRYLKDYAVKYGSVDGEAAVQERIDRLVEYIQSIQE